MSDTVMGGPADTVDGGRHVLDHPSLTPAARRMAGDPAMVAVALQREQWERVMRVLDQADYQSLALTIRDQLA